MVERHGYNVKRHSTTTDDGYILTVFRVTSKNKEPTKSPVFIQHGITLNSANWVDISNRSLGIYQLRIFVLDFLNIFLRSI
jgi:lysosomal acid lipase/cholesteryl ester hydrolase